MDIFLNGKPVEYEIETETTIGQVIDYVAKWLLGQGAVLVSGRLDGQSFDLLENSEIRSTSIKEHHKLEFESQNARLLVIETVNELGQYLDRVARLAPGLTEKEITEETVTQLVDGLWWCEDVFKRVEEILRLSFREIEFEGEKLHKRILRLGDIRDHIGAAFKGGNHAALRGLLRDSVGPLCDTLVRAIPIILEKGELNYPTDGLKEELEELLPSLQQLPERLEAIAVKISIGDSARGMQEFAEAVSALEKAFLFVEKGRKQLAIPDEELVMDGKSFEERNQALSGILSELIEAFERRDRVLIGDLIEYEIAPVTQARGLILEKIGKNAKGSCH